MRSSGCVLKLGGAEHLVAEMRADILRRAQIDRSPAKELGKLSLNGSKAEQAGLLAVE